MARGRGRNRGNDDERLRNMLQSEIRLDGRGEDQVIKDLVDLIHNRADKTDFEAMQIAIGVYEHLYDKEISGERKTGLLERAKDRDEAVEEYEQQGEAWVQEQIERGRRMHEVTDKKKAEAMKNAESLWQKGLAKAQANKMSQKQKIRHRLKTDPKETIYVEPQFETVDMGGGRKDRRKYGEIIRVADFEFVLRPGMQEVPKYVAEKYRERKQAREKTREREELMMAEGGDHKGLEYNELRRRWRELDQEDRGRGGELMSGTGHLETHIYGDDE